MEKVILEVTLGDCEFFSTYELKFDTYEDALAAQEALEKSSSVVCADIKVDL